MSCDSGLIDYRENTHSASFSYYDFTPIYSPTSELFTQLERISEWVVDQNGSRTVQDIFDIENSARKDLIFNAIYKDTMYLITDRFGNYVFQKIF